MRQNKWFLLGGFVCLTILTVVPAFAVNELTIACEGTESTGGGMLRYQYTLTNPTPTPVPVDYFYIGTNDLNQTNYSTWVAPPGFTAVGTVGTYAFLDDAFPINFSGMGTTRVKTPHTVLPPQVGFGTDGAIVWQCTQPGPGGPCDLGTGGTLTFGFDNPNASADAEWLVDGSIPTASFIESLIAGPLGTYTNGWVHSPTDDGQAVPDTNVWGLALLFAGLAVVIAGAIAFAMRRKVA